MSRFLSWIRRMKPYLVEVTGFAWESLWYHSLHGKFVAGFKENQYKRLMKNVKYGVYVTNEAFAGQSAGKVLFKSEGLSRYSPESFRAWQRAAASSESGIGTASCAGRIGLNKPGEILEAAGFCTEHSANARSIGYEEERSPTLRAGVVPAAIALENHPADSRVKISEDGKVQTLTSR